MRKPLIISENPPCSKKSRFCHCRGFRVTQTGCLRFRLDQTFQSAVRRTARTILPTVDDWRCPEQRFLLTGLPTGVLRSTRIACRQECCHRASGRRLKGHAPLPYREHPWPSLSPRLRLNEPTLQIAS